MQPSTYPGGEKRGEATMHKVFGCHGRTPKDPRGSEPASRLTCTRASHELLMETAQIDARRCTPEDGHPDADPKALRPFIN